MLFRSVNHENTAVSPCLNLQKQPTGKVFFVTPKIQYPHREVRFPVKDFPFYLGYKVSAYTSQAPYQATACARKAMNADHDISNIFL